MKDTNVSIFKNLFKSSEVPFVVPLWKSLERIKQGKSKHLIDEIRKGNKELKKKLPSILFAGEFSERNSRSLVSHSGLMIVDFDKYPSNERMLSHLSDLKENPHFISLFISPSGNGIKGVVRVSNTLDKDTHPQVFKAFQKEFNFDFFDISNSNVDRVCFESFDPNIYINYDAKVFEPEIKDEGYSVVERIPIVPISNEDVIMDKIMQWNWGKDFREGERNNFIFDIAGAFCEYGIPQSSAEGYILNNVVIGKFSDREAITTISSAYKIRSFNSKYFEDYRKIERIKSDLKKERKEVTQKHNIDDKTYDLIKEEKEQDDFWYYEKEKVKVDNLKYKWFLERNGFKKYFPANSEKPTWVRVTSNIVRETSVEKIKDFVMNYLLEKEEFEVWKFCSNYQNIFSETFLLILESIELFMLRDKVNKSYIAYRNGILEITSKKSILKEYIDIDGYVWEDQIIQRDYKELENDDNDYKKFVSNISHNESLAIECSIGYLLSTYKNKSNNKAIILNDEEISANPEGGTGKGLFVQGLSHIRKVCILDGKGFDDKKSFPYQTVTQDTQILVFDDVKKNFDFESKFSLVTEGITLERKNKDAIKLSVEESPKMLISTNYAIKGEGNSHDRRRHELEVAQYYGKNKTPYDEFQKHLFDDWDEQEYLRFDNYMVGCIQKYLSEGLVKQNAKNLELRKFIAESSMEFYEWISDNTNFDLNNRNDKSEAFNQFVEDYKDYKRWLSRKRFNSWVKKYAYFINAKYEEGNSNGIRWFSIITKTQKQEEEEVSEVPF